MRHLNFHSHEKVSERVYVVTEGYSRVHRFTIGVVIGDEKVLVIDSGLGMTGDLRTYIEGFAGTEKPMICACTHGNIDHVGAACLFDEAYLNHGDHVDVLRAFDNERRLRDLSAFSLFNDEVIAYGREHMIEDNSKVVFKDIDEGQVFDLGGISVEPIRTLGHTEGHLAYYIRQENIAFGGDAINVSTGLKRLDREGLLAYRDMLYRFLSITGDDVAIYAGHLNRPHKSNVPRNLALACEEVANGETRGDPPAESIFPEKAGNPALRMHYHGNSCIIYNSSHLK